MWLNVVDGVQFIIIRLSQAFDLLDFEIARLPNFATDSVYSVTFLDFLFFIFVFYIVMKFFIFRH